MEGLPIVIDTWGLATEDNPSFPIANKCWRGCGGVRNPSHWGGGVDLFEFSGLPIDPAKIVIQIFAELEVIQKVRRC